ncbi:MAG TPA: hypothetical protein VF950_15900 [Planctomycetota bacterium]
MGREIFACWKCGDRLFALEFEKGRAFQVGTRSSCAACVPELLATLPPGDCEKVLAKLFEPTHKRAGPRNSLGRVAPPTSIPPR